MLTTEQAWIARSPDPKNPDAPFHYPGLRKIFAGAYPVYRLEMRFTRPSTGVPINPGMRADQLRKIFDLNVIFPICSCLVAVEVSQPPRSSEKFTITIYSKNDGSVNDRIEGFKQLTNRQLVEIISTGTGLDPKLLAVESRNKIDEE